MPHARIIRAGRLLALLVLQAALFLTALTPAGAFACQEPAGCAMPCEHTLPSIQAAAGGHHAHVALHGHLSRTASASHEATVGLCCVSGTYVPSGIPGGVTVASLRVARVVYQGGGAPVGGGVEALPALRPPRTLI